MKRKWNISSEQIHKKCLDEIIDRVLQQEGSTFGVIAGEDIIQIVLQNLAPDIYNLALKDVQKVISDKLSDLEVDIDLLSQSS